MLLMSKLIKCILKYPVDILMKFDLARGMLKSMLMSGLKCLLTMPHSHYVLPL